MPQIQNFTWIKQDDGTLNISLVPPQAIGGRAVEWYVTKRTGGEDKLIRKLANSGYNNASGITITDSGQGKFSIDMVGNNTSGFDYGNYAHRATVTTSGRQVTTTEGFMILTP